MGNVTPRPTNRLSLLVNEVQDVSLNISNNIVQQASQITVATQTQQISFDNLDLKNCTVTISQGADIVNKLDAVFRTILTNPRLLLKQLTEGPNSMLGQLFASTSKNVQDFLNIVKNRLGATDQTDMRLKLTNIFKLNISNSVLQQCSQNVFVNQEQTAQFVNTKCQNGSIDIKQDLIINSAMTCIFEITQNLLLSNPVIRQSVREFNGDYDKGLLNKDLEAGMTMPDACFYDKPKTAIIDCAPCESCPPVTSCDNIVFRAWFLWISLIIPLTLIGLYLLLTYKYK